MKRIALLFLFCGLTVTASGLLVDNQVYTNQQGETWEQNFTWAVQQVNEGMGSTITFDLPSNEVSISTSATFTEAAYLNGSNAAGNIQLTGIMVVNNFAEFRHFDGIGEIRATNAYYMELYNNTNVGAVAGPSGVYFGNTFSDVFTVEEGSEIESNIFTWVGARLTHSNKIERNTFLNNAVLVCGSGNSMLNNEGMNLSVTGDMNTVQGGAAVAVGISGSDNTIRELAVSGSGVTVSGSNNELDYLTVFGSSRYGVKLGGERNSLQHSTVARCKGPGILVEGEYIDVGDPAVASAGNTVYGNFGGGIKVYDANQVMITGNSIGSTNDDYDAAASGNIGFGVYVKDSYHVTVGLLEANKGNRIIGNVGPGLKCEADPGDNLFFNANLNTIAKSMGNGVEFWGGTNFHLHGNFIGLDADETPSLGNLGHGVQVKNKAQANIGGTATNARNIISGNQAAGIYIEGYYGNSSAGCRIQNNYIGTSRDGRRANPNGMAGIVFQDVRDALIGGTEPGEGNLISGNTGAGIKLQEKEYTLYSTYNITIAGNDIGVDSTGTNVLGNGGGGIYIAAMSNLVGGASTNARNVIGGNGKYGIALVALDKQVSTRGNLIQGNYIGVSRDGTTAVGNTGDGVLLDGSGATYTYVASNTVGVDAALDLAAGNVIANNSGCGIRFMGGGIVDTYFDGNLVGTDPSGTVAMPNAKAGLYIGDGYSDRTRIGTRAGNVFSGNSGHGIQLADGSNSKIMNNRVGTDYAGQAAVPNGGSGIHIGAQARRTDVGSTRTNGANIVVWNGQYGVDNEGQESDIAGNYIGVLPGGQSAVNAGRYGIRSTASYTTLGGKEPDEGNIIDAATGIGILNVSSNSGRLRHYVDGNIIGYHPLSVLPATNLEYGIYISGSSSYSRVGTDARNLIGGASQVAVYASNVQWLAVADCWIGCVTNAAGRVGNPGGGIELHDAYAATIGGISGSAGANYIDGTSFGLYLDGVSNTAYARNMIGRGPDGITHGISGDGIFVRDGKYINLGDAEQAALVITGCGGAGIRLENCHGGRILGGQIGMDTNGVLQGCGEGIVMTNCVGVEVGDLMYPNYIAGSSNHGVAVYGTASMSNILSGAAIGLMPDGSVAGNTGHGVYIRNASRQTLSQCRIAGSEQCGIFVEGDAATGNQFTQNTIWSNGCSGIGLGTCVPVANDDQDPDPGPNRLQNYPVITAVWAGETRIQGTFNSTPNRDFVLEFYVNDSANTNGVAEGQRFLCQEWITTDAQGDAAFDAWSYVPIATNKLVTAIATDMETMDTSPFSENAGRGEQSVLPPDSNDDGMADYWEDRYPSMKAAHTGSQSDYDGDGYTDVQEYLAMTDPEDAGSFPRMALHGVNLAVPDSSSGRIYVLQQTDALGDAAEWHEVSRTNGVDYESLVFEMPPRSNAVMKVFRVVTEMP